MEDMELLECLIETEIKTLEYKIGLAKKRENKEMALMYKHQRAGLKRALGFMIKIEDMEE